MKDTIPRIVALIWILTPGISFSETCTENFSWIPNPEGDIAGYKIHYGLSDGGPYTNSINVATPVIVGDSITASVQNLVCGEHYYFVCTAYNTTGLESDYSEQVDAIATSPSTNTETVTKVFGSATGAEYAGAIQDTFINISSENNESNTRLNTYTWPANKVANAILLKIDLSPLPQTAQVQSAVLQLYATEAGGDDTYDISAHTIINYNPDLSKTTGFTYDGTNGWTANASCYNNIPMAQADISVAAATTSVDMSLGYKSWDITNMVNEWQADSTNNFGLLLNSDNNAAADSYRIFASSEASSDQRPKLVITYTTIGNTLPTPAGFKFMK